MVRPPVNDAICLRCRSRLMLCGKRICPILMKSSILRRLLPDKTGFERLKRSGRIFGASPPAFFVGRFGYPAVSVGPMIPIDGDRFVESGTVRRIGDHKDTRILDLTELWFGKSIDEIVEYRTSLFRTGFTINVRGASVGKSAGLPVELLEKKLPSSDKKLLEVGQELAMSKKSVDTESEFSRLRINIQYDVHSPPVGPTARAEKIEIMDNIKVHPKVEYVVGDTDLKASEAIFNYLYRTYLPRTDKNPRPPDSDNVVTGTEMHRLLSAGLLGVGHRRKLVPTRWAITAVDSVISLGLISIIKHYLEINTYYVFREEYIGNRFAILLIPGPWAFEMMEVWDMNTIWTQAVPGVQNAIRFKEPRIYADFETERGRKDYAENVTGAYYAARKEVAEFFYRIGRQGKCVVFREVDGGYLIPLGVWVIRESVKHALTGGLKGDNVKSFDTLGAALSEVGKIMHTPLKYWVRASGLLKHVRVQKTLDEWIRIDPRKVA